MQSLRRQLLWNPSVPLSKYLGIFIRVNFLSCPLSSVTNASCDPRATCTWLSKNVRRRNVTYRLSIKLASVSGSASGARIFTGRGRRKGVASRIIRIGWKWTSVDRGRTRLASWCIGIERCRVFRVKNTRNTRGESRLLGKYFRAKGRFFPRCSSIFLNGSWTRGEVQRMALSRHPR